MLFLAIYFAIFGGDYTVFEIRKMEALEQERAAELASTEAEIDSLEAVAQMLEHDPEAIERVARERYGMIREGEILYRFREPAPRDTSTIDGAGEGE
ncbi:MAG: septum formation initiator family protein [Gemmatimonadota bacterium]|nr:MAG: septum formation initiator family protein [Gemmatimonadota bacterium]